MVCENGWRESALEIMGETRTLLRVERDPANEWSTQELLLIKEPDDELHQYRRGLDGCLEEGSTGGLGVTRLVHHHMKTS
ncbi:hypothetical protein U9M48_000603 [Paspalum notatum var. saurae]|uniref:Uncharacterized protein n=1 Tax=Paspalum notatum var. saurae TaxID=547442 RepID=A0AAQ3PKG4_PASNO